MYHLGGGEPISWYNYARLIFELAGLSPDLKPTNAQEYRTAARRPGSQRCRTQRLKRPGSRPCRRCDKPSQEYLPRAITLLRIVRRRVVALPRLDSIFRLVDLDVNPPEVPVAVGI